MYKIAFASFQETFKVMYFDTIVDTREGLNRIMGHFTSIECITISVLEYETGGQVKTKALDTKYALIKDYCVITRT